ncbi:MAG: DNA polymerase III subunit gamma/tau [Chloroflexota bacterium]
MGSQVFYLKWRPQTLADVVGQPQVTRTLLNALSSGRVSHAYLFCGPRGTGKTSTGRILAKAVNCLTGGQGEPCNACPMCQAITGGGALDVIEVDAASNRGIDEIRSLRERVNYAPSQARYKVYIIDEVHMLTPAASNALLKTLEEPPPHVIFVLATTEIHKVLPTILSRCQRFDFRRISQADVVARLEHICRAEKISIEAEALRLIARSATGSLRDAENLLEQLTTYYGSEVGLAQVQAVLGITGDRRTVELVKNLLDKDIAAGLATINAVNADGLDLRQFNREVVEYLRGLLLVKTGAGGGLDLTGEDLAEMKKLAAGASLPQVLTAVKLFGQLELGLDNYATLPLELALVDSVLAGEGETKTALPADQAAPSREAAAPPAPAPAARPAPRRPEPAAKAPPKAAVKPPAEAGPEVVEPAPLAPREAVAPGPVAAETVAEPVAAAGGEIERLRSNWKQVIEQAPPDTRRTPALAILRSAGVKPVIIEDDTVVLSFRYDVHREQMEKPENQRVAEQVVSQFLGRSCRVRCTHEPEGNHLLRAALKMGGQIISVEEK